MIVAYTALHYGSPYLEWAIRSVIDYVDEYIVLYSPQGSHGHRVNHIDLPPSDDKEQLQWIVYQAAKGKHRWIDGNWTHEGQQRDNIYQYAPDADLIIVLDYDEIWPETLVKVVTDIDGDHINALVDVYEYDGTECPFQVYRDWRDND